MRTNECFESASVLEAVNRTREAPIGSRELSIKRSARHFDTKIATMFTCELAGFLHVLTNGFPGL